MKTIKVDNNRFSNKFWTKKASKTKKKFKFFQIKKLKIK